MASRPPTKVWDRVIFRTIELQTDLAGTLNMTEDLKKFDLPTLILHSGRNGSHTA